MKRLMTSFRLLNLNIILYQNDYYYDGSNSDGGTSMWLTSGLVVDSTALFIRAC